MNIVSQFATSPIFKKITTVTVTSGSSVMLASGSTSLMWRTKTNGGNAQEVRILSQTGNVNQYFVMEAGDDTGWNAGNPNQLWVYGTGQGDAVCLWESY
jgi:hypothetical protein